MGQSTVGKVIQQVQQKKKTTPKDSNNFYEEYIQELKQLFWDTANEVVPGFAIDDNNREIIPNLFYYFIGVEGKYDLNKGLWIMGGNGTGKTKLLKIFSVFGQKRFQGFKVYECMTISNEYATKGDIDKYTYNQLGAYGGQKPTDMGFDELGRETIPANHFGQKLNVMQYILHIRYSLWQSDGIKTYITTNLSTDEVHNLYDGEKDRFISDRCREMFNVVPLLGESRRK